MAGIGRVGYEEALCYMLSVYLWLSFGDDVNVHGCALRVGYRHGSEILVFSYDVLSLSNTEHRRTVHSSIVKLPDLFDPSVESFSCAVGVVGHAFNRRPEVLVITVHVFGLRVERVPVDIV